MAEARDHADMREANDALAAGMQAVGLDRWRARLGDYAERAQSEWLPLAAGQRYQFRLAPDPVRIQNVAIDFDPRDVPLTPTAQKLQELLELTGRVVVAEMNVELWNRPMQSASSTLHKRFADEIERMHLPGVTVEGPFDLAGDATGYSARGSVRTDIVFTNPETGRIEGVWDWKVGGASLSLKRAQELSERLSRVAGKPDLPSYQIPVRELHVDPIVVKVP